MVAIRPLYELHAPFGLITLQTNLLTYVWSLTCSVTDLDRHLWWTLSPNSVNGFWWFLVRWKAESLEFTTHSTRNGIFHNNFVSGGKRVEIVIEIESQKGGMGVLRVPKTKNFEISKIQYSSKLLFCCEEGLYQFVTQMEQNSASAAEIVIPGI